jgi:hypothetical protein
MLNPSRLRVVVLSASLVASAPWLLPGARAWDSASGNPTHATHTYLTEWALNRLGPVYPELALPATRQAVVDGANTELHELPSRSYEKSMAQKYNLPLEVFRVRYKGTNEGADDVAGWWRESLSEYRQGRKGRAYFLLGVILHMIQDMGVPAHANKVVHQGNLTEFDNFEFLALSNWKPSFDAIDRTDPTFDEPWRYYQFSQQWTHADAPNYNNRDAFSKFWATASATERRLLRNRQGRTCQVTAWTIASAAKAFGLIPNPRP